MKSIGSSSFSSSWIIFIGEIFKKSPTWSDCWLFFMKCYLWFLWWFFLSYTFLSGLSNCFDFGRGVADKLAFKDVYFWCFNTFKSRELVLLYNDFKPDLRFCCNWSFLFISIYFPKNLSWSSLFFLLGTPWFYFSLGSKRGWSTTTMSSSLINYELFNSFSFSEILGVLISDKSLNI